MSIPPLELIAQLSALGNPDHTREEQLRANNFRYLSHRVMEKDYQNWRVRYRKNLETYDYNLESLRRI